jgi:hypothetical protein
MVLGIDFLWIIVHTTFVVSIPIPIMESFQVNVMTVKIMPDSEPLDPRKEFDNVGIMVCWHKKYSLGDIQPKEDPMEYLRQIMENRVYSETRKWIPDDISEEDIKKYMDKHFVMLPLYLMDHSGLSISTGSFGCPWDSGQVGFIYVDKDSKDYDDLTAGLTSEVDIYNKFLSGDVWGYDIENGDGDVVDSCFGFYGFDRCKEEALHIASGY